jgi:phthiodiolone/phenolphthiodiolone dimycocerosates ketoreductase
MPSQDLKFGSLTPHYPPMEGIVAAAKDVERRGLDFVAFGDQLQGTEPGSIMTPDIVPGKARITKRQWTDAFLQCTMAAMSTREIELTVFTDALRRGPAILAQTAITLDHISHGRFFLTVGAGEAKQFRPFGFERNKPFLHLEEQLKILRLFFERREPFSYSGPIWSIDEVTLYTGPYDAKRSIPLIVMGGPGKAVEIAARHADGWLCFLPQMGTPEWYAEQVKQIRETRERDGKDPDAFRFMITAHSIISDDEDTIRRVSESPLGKWGAIVFVPGGRTWRRWGGEHPMGDDWFYSRDLEPNKWSREKTLAAIAKVPPKVVLASKFVGTMDSVARQVQAYIDAGATHVRMANYVSILEDGSFGTSDVGKSNLTVETMSLIRRNNGLGDFRRRAE